MMNHRHNRKALLRTGTAVLLSLLLIVTACPFFASAASLEVVNGENMVFVSSFGKLSYGGAYHDCYTSIVTANAVIGKKAGRIVFSGPLSMSSFTDTTGRGLRVFEGATNAEGCILDFSSKSSLELRGDTAFSRAAIKMGSGKYIYANGNSLSIAESCTVSGAPSVAPGTVDAGKNCVIRLLTGTYGSIGAGSYASRAIKSPVTLIARNITADKAAAGNLAAGTMTGDAAMMIADSKVTNIYAGTISGTLNGSSATLLQNVTASNLVLGASSSSATVSGNASVIVNGGSINRVSKGSGTVKGKTVLVLGFDTEVAGADNAADYVVRVSGGSADPLFSGNNVSGVYVSDGLGQPARRITLNGESMSAEDGVYPLNAASAAITVIGGASGDGVNTDASFIAGYEDGAFRPEDKLTRAQAVTMLARLFSEEAANGGAASHSSLFFGYADVPADAWYAPAVMMLGQRGYLDAISRNYGISFDPEEEITRGEFAELIYQLSDNIAAASSVKLMALADVPDTDDHYHAISSCVSGGILTGYEDGTFRPASPLTRAEAVTIINRFIGREPTVKADLSRFYDVSAHWAASQIAAACGTKNVDYTGGHTVGGNYVLTGSSAKDYVTGLVEQSAKLSADAIRAGVDTVAAQMKKDVLNSKDELTATGTVYYISEKHGNDSNNGTSSSTPWKTLDNLRTSKFKGGYGVCVLFERGGIYRGQIKTVSGVSYGAYGKGEKPLIMESAQNYAYPGLWQTTEWPNVYKCTKKLVNVGVMGFDHDLFDHSDDTYNEKYGYIMNIKTFGFTGPQDLKSDLQFYSVLPNGSTSTAGDLYLYSESGNPGSRFSSIEIGENIPIVTGAANDVTLDNLAFKFTGGHGMGSAGGCKNRVVQNCVYSWIGGSVLSYNGENQGVTNYGNAIEIYGSCNGYRVENCWIYQIYDTGVTHQYSSDAKCTQEGVRYYGNLIEYCFWGIEFYNAPPAVIDVNSTTKYTRDVHDAYNVLRMGGYGWGSIVRFRTGQFYCGSSLSANYDELTEYNIFDRCSGNLLNLPSNANEVQDHNIYIQTRGKPLGNLRGSTYTTGDDAAEAIRKCWGDENAVVIVVEPEA